MNTINQQVHRSTIAFKAGFSNNPATRQVLDNDVKYSYDGSAYLYALEHNLRCMSSNVMLDVIKLPLKEPGFLGHTYYVKNPNTNACEEFVVKNSIVNCNTQIYQSLPNYCKGNTFSSVAEAMYKVIMQSERLIPTTPAEREKFIEPELEGFLGEKEMATLAEIMQNCHYPSQIRSAVIDTLKRVAHGGYGHRVSPRVEKQAMDIISKNRIRF